MSVFLAASSSGNMAGIVGCWNTAAYNFSLMTGNLNGESYGIYFRKAGHY